MDRVDPAFFTDVKSFSTVPYIVEILEKSSTIDERDRAHLSDTLASVNEEVGAIVEEHHEGFNNSVASFSKTFQEFTDAQNKVKRLNEYVKKSKEALVNRKRNLKDLWFQKLQHLHVLKLVTDMETVQRAPEKFEEYLIEKKYIECVEHFQQAHSLAFSESLACIGALSETREYLVSMKEEIQEALIEAVLEYLLIKSGTYSEYLSSAISALLKLGRLEACLHRVKVYIREEMGLLISQSFSKAELFARPLGLIVEQEKIDDIRFRQLMDSVIHDMTHLLDRHVELANILKTVAPQVGKINYSLQETWSIIQVEVQQIVELHTSSRKQENEAADINEQAYFNMGIVSFSALDSMDVGNRIFRTLERKPIFTPSPYRVLSVIDSLVLFAKNGDSIAETLSRAQLVAYMRELCENNFIPALRLGCMTCIQMVKVGRGPLEPGGWVGSQIGQEVCTQLEELAQIIPLLVPLRVNVDTVIIDVLQTFVEFCSFQVNKILEGKSCRKWRDMLKEDPSYFELISSEEGSGVKNVQDYQQAYLKFTENEKKEQVNTDGNRLSLKDIQNLASIFITCDRLFRVLVLRKGSNDSKVKSFVELVLQKDVIAVLDSSSLRDGALSTMDKICEQCIFSLRTEFLIQATITGSAVAKELTRKNDLSDQSPSCSIFVQEIVSAVRVLEPLIGIRHLAYVIQPVCSLISASLLVSLRTIPRPTFLHISFLNRAVILIQQCLWTVLNMNRKDASTKMQLRAFDGAREFLNSFQVQRDSSEFDKTLDDVWVKLLGSIDRSELEKIRRIKIS